MVSYYESFSRLSATTVTNGHRQEQLAMDRATFAVYASQWAADSARRYYNIENAKVKVIPFGANLEISHSVDAVVQMIKARPRDRCRLLFIGVEWKRKGGALAVETARLLNEAGLPTTLRVVGCDPFRRSETPPFVERLGFISKRTDSGRAKLQDLLSTSHFLILPSRAEAAGIVFCEASAFGLPSITTDTGGIPTYIRNGMNGICLSLEATADEYAREIYKLFVDRDRYEHMGIDSFCEYETRLNWRTAVTSLIHLMKECTA
jgi:glycosyltransferase involved in cell wall biosynthesis